MIYDRLDFCDDCSNRTKSNSCNMLSVHRNNQILVHPVETIVVKTSGDKQTLRRSVWEAFTTFFVPVWKIYFQNHQFRYIRIVLMRSLDIQESRIRFMWKKYNCLDIKVKFGKTFPIGIWIFQIYWWNEEYLDFVFV